MAERTEAQTPAPKRDQIKGSAKNPKGSASGSRGNIKISDEQVKALENLRDAHNEKYSADHKKVDLGTLKAVYRRGAGAFSTSHRPNVTSRAQWALARVKAFLKLVGTGQRKKSYTTDLDLLDKGHPQSTRASEAEALAPQKYAHIDFTPPKAAQKAAERALRRRAEKSQSNRGMTPTGIARARDLKNGKELSPNTVRRMLSYFQRHEVDKQGSTWASYGKGRQAWDGWGGDAGFRWAQKVVNQMNAADEKAKNLAEWSEYDDSTLTEDDGLYVGRPFKTLGLGQIHSRTSGNMIAEITAELLNELARVYNERSSSDNVPIDWNHNSSPFIEGADKRPDASGALGEIISVEVREDDSGELGLYVTPAYTDEGKAIVERHQGTLYSSPEFLTGAVYDRDTGNLVSELGQLLAVTLTHRPQQTTSRIERVTLSETLKEAYMERSELESMEHDKLIDMLMQKDELVKQLEQRIKSAGEDKDKDKAEAMSEEPEQTQPPQPAEPVAMSEAASVALAEMKSQIKAQEDVIRDLMRERSEAKRSAWVKDLINDGRITPAEQQLAEAAFDQRESGVNIFAEHLEGRAVSSAVPLAEVGHAQSAEEVTSAQFMSLAREHQKAEGVSLSEALKFVSNKNPAFKQFI